MAEYTAVLQPIPITAGEIEQRRAEAERARDDERRAGAEWSAAGDEVVRLATELDTLRDRYGKAPRDPAATAEVMGELKRQIETAEHTLALARGRHERLGKEGDDRRVLREQADARYRAAIEEARRIHDRLPGAVRALASRQRDVAQREHELMLARSGVETDSQAIEDARRRYEQLTGGQQL